MQAVGQRLGVRIELFVEAHRVPAILAPVLPVLHEHIDGHLLLLEAVGRLKNLLRRVETLAAMDITQSP